MSEAIIEPTEAHAASGGDRSASAAPATPRNRDQENVAAALAALDSVAETLARDTETVKAHLDRLHDRAHRLEERLHQQQIEHARTEQDLRTRLDAATRKLSRIQLLID